MSLKIDDIKIEYLYFHFIDKKGGDILKQQNGGLEKLPAPIHAIYSEHIHEVAMKKPSAKSYDILEIDPGASNDVKKRLSKMTKMIIPEKTQEFISNAQELTRQLYEKMRGNARPGVLFTNLIDISGSRYICVLKLEWVDESYCDFDSNTSSFSLTELVRKIPARGRFQKGMIFPHPFHPTKAYMKVYQEDSEANYFDKFLGGLPKATAKVVMKEIRKLANKHVKGGNLTVEDSLSLFAGLEKHVGKTQKLVEEKDVIRIIQDALPSAPKPDIASSAKGKFNRSGIIQASEVDDLSLKFDIGKLTLSGPFNSILNDFKKIKSSPDSYKIKGAITNVKMGR
ncbi:MAG: nucleoid-associated protein [Candidatus Thorarchaeota archaeon]